MAAAIVAVSCDGSLLVASGSGAPRVWEREGDDWAQRHGAPAAPPATDAPGVERASCTRAPVSNTPMVPAGAKRVGGSSRDRSLLWSHQTGSAGWHFVARLWTGERYRAVIDETGPAT